MIQKTEWGNINWIHTNNEDNQSFNVGITTLLPGKCMSKHVHYGVEQFLYILEGEGIYIINEEKKNVQKNMFFYLDPDIVHETINTGTGPLKELLISRPVTYNSNIKIDENMSYNTKDTSAINMNNILYAAVEAIRTQLLESISLPFTIYDDMWSIVIQNNNFSNYCISKCNPVNNHVKCSCMMQRNFNELNKEEGTRFICEYGLSVFNYPIIYNNIKLGTIRGGHILISDLTTENHDELYDSPESTIIGIKSLLKQIVRSITSYCSFHESRQLIEKKDMVIKEEMSRNETLKNNLYIINDKVTNLRINHHFLFNTLNSIASMSLSGDRYDLYNSIINLSKMFRYTMTVDLKFVTLDSEIEYLETYLNLQRLRYGRELEIHYDIADNMKAIKVPFNFIQPIVENAFTHGFVPSDVKKVIRISVQDVKNKAVITIVNNGVPLNDITRNRVNKGLSRNTGHGLSLVYEKLESAYKSEFNMDISSNFNEETNVIVEIPIVY
ncbi:MAG: histidine kinase [Sedimentibacter sp.]|uniref:histidine kinase n=1 Tax=Sedimentibacter sp. TaxID=1960295 RepID=UPI003159807A